MHNDVITPKIILNVITDGKYTQCWSEIIEFIQHPNHIQEIGMDHIKNIFKQFILFSPRF